MTIPLKCILLVEDSPRDTELTLDALAQHNLANEVVAVRDGAEALDFLQRRGSFATRPAGNPAVVLLDLKMPKAVKLVGAFWAVVNEPPPGCIRPLRRTLPL
ncbi:MAG: hypothetical protein NTV22_00100 [bacterium]|nr:hypothetical protein [bacterium]